MGLIKMPLTMIITIGIPTQLVACTRKNTQTYLQNCCTNSKYTKNYLFNGMVKVFYQNIYGCFDFVFIDMFKLEMTLSKMTGCNIGDLTPMKKMGKKQIYNKQKKFT